MEAASHTHFLSNNAQIFGKKNLPQPSNYSTHCGGNVRKVGEKEAKAISVTIYSYSR